MDNNDYCVFSGWQGWVKILMGFILYGLSTLPLYAVTFNVNVKVTVQGGGCDVFGASENAPITVNFGDVVAAQVNGQNYKQPIPYQLKCPSNTATLRLWLSSTNTVTVAGQEGLQTSNPNLGLLLKAGDNALNVGDKVNFTFSTPPNLWAIPAFTQSTNELKGGDFTASATLNIEYQ